MAGLRPGASNPEGVTAVGKMNRGMDMLDTALRLLHEMAGSLAELRRLAQTRPRNAIGAGAVPQQTPVGQAPVAVLPANPQRRGLYIVNTGATTITLGLGIGQPAPGIGLVIPAGQPWAGLLGNALWDGSISAIGSAGGGLLSVTEA